MKTLIFSGMCYSGKSTLGKKIADILKVPFLDEEDVFFKIYGMSILEYLTRYGKDAFLEAERKSLYYDFDGAIFSLGGSHIYHAKEMKMLNEKYEIIWLDVDFISIENRKKNNEREHIIYPEGIESFEVLYQERKKLYQQYFTHRITVGETETIEETIHKILLQIQKAEG